MSREEQMVMKNPCQHSVLVPLFCTSQHRAMPALWGTDSAIFRKAETLLWDVPDLSCAAQRMASKYEKLWQKSDREWPL